MTTPQITPTPQPSPDALKASYGFVAALAGAIPELQQILSAALAGQWTSDRFIMAVSASDWYRQNADTVREWITKQQVDPATAQQDWIRASGEAWTFAWQNGIQLSDPQAAEAALWKMFNPSASADMFRVHLARTYFNPNQDWSQMTGAAAGFATQIQEIGRQYGWDDQDNFDQSRQWLGRLMRGEDTIEGFQNAMLNYAAVKYPSLQDQLKGGLTLRQIADPYMSSYSRILEMPQTAINWYQDNLMQQALQYTGQGDTQTAGSMPMYMFEQKLRQDPRWRKTNNALDQTAQLIQKIGQDWGYYG